MLRFRFIAARIARQIWTIYASMSWCNGLHIDSPFHFVQPLVCFSHLVIEVNMIIYLSLLVALVGVLMYALAANPKLVEIGRIAFGAGLLAFLLCACEHGGKLFGIAAQ